MRSRIGAMLVISAILSCMFTSACVAQRDISDKHNIGDVIGEIYSTDIKANIDCMPITSYNIGGKTVVAVSDLSNYGFNISFNEEKRKVHINATELPNETPQLSSSMFSADLVNLNPGAKIGDLLYTNIDTTFSSTDIELYNVDGYTFIALEDLGGEIEANGPDISHNTVLGYNTMGYKAVWNGNNRTISLQTLRKGVSIETEYGILNIDQYVDLAYDKFWASYSSNLEDDLYRITPVYDGNVDDNTYTDSIPLFKTVNVAYKFKDGKFVINVPTETIPIQLDGNMGGH
ncbi:MAG: hypothetical protein RR957_04040, partial [Oscillospiraceae bacterium]